MRAWAEAEVADGSSSLTGAARRKAADALAATLPPLLIAADRVASTVAQGVHGRRRVGVGESFWQFRRYQAGEPIGRIDWRQSGKSEGLFQRETEWAAVQTAWLWRDASPSMDYRSDRSLPTKRDRAEVLLLALASLLNRAGERVALIGGDTPPATGRASLLRLAAALDRGTLDDASKAVPWELRVPRHAAMVLLGDCLAPLDEFGASVAAYAARGVRGHILQVLDPAEATLPFEGRIRFEGIEEVESALIPRVRSVRDAYRERLAEHQDGLAAIARRAGWSFAVHRTDKSAEAALLSLWGVMSGAATGRARW
ncbi:DUF58 domain-containing protein [Inquilinus sp. OTU3971]|uniref:DUF58 domain-containing protein n=1 Tax=Inquilinus sp. OTU3971 TaxID=3043855 RepID=UPI00313C58FB